MPLVAAETAASYDGGDRIATLAAAVDVFLATSLDELDEPAIKAELGALETLGRRVDARKARATAVLADRHARRAAQANPDGGAKVKEQARRQRRNELADELGWSPSESKRNEQYGQALNQSPDLALAADDGEIRAGNAVKLSRFLTRLNPEDRAKVEDRALQAARTQDPVTFGHTIDRLRAELSPPDAEQAEIRRHDNRKAAVTTTDEGMTRLYAEFATLDGALVKRAIDAYRRLDTPGEWRRPEQRTADAIVDMARAALHDTNHNTNSSTDDPNGTDDHGTPGGDTPDGDTDGGGGGERPRPGRNHGVRPHVVVTVPIDVLLAGAGMVDVDGEPVPLGAIRHLMDDAGWSFVVTKTNTTPLAVTGESRTVPAGLWRALVIRDRGCIHEGCDHKAEWCDVMHLDVAYRDGGRLSPHNAALGCRNHHRSYDNGQLELHWEDDRPVLRRKAPSTESRAGPAP